MRDNKKDSKPAHYARFHNLLVLSLLDTEKVAKMAVDKGLSLEEKIARRTEVVKATVIDGGVLRLYLPTYEQVLLMYTYFKRSLANQSFALELLCETESGFLNPVDKRGPEICAASDGKFETLMSRRMVNATHRLHLQICRSQKYGAAMQFMMYFYSQTDMDVVSSVLNIGLASVYMVMSSERRSPLTNDWIGCDMRVHCDKTVAEGLDQLTYTNLCRVRTLVTELLAAQTGGGKEEATSVATQ